MPPLSLTARIEALRAKASAEGGLSLQEDAELCLLQRAAFLQIEADPMHATRKALQQERRTQLAAIEQQALAVRACVDPTVSPHKAGVFEMPRRPVKR